MENNSDKNESIPTALVVVEVVAEPVCSSSAVYRLKRISNYMLGDLNNNSPHQFIPSFALMCGSGGCVMITALKS